MVGFFDPPVVDATPRGRGVRKGELSLQITAALDLIGGFIVT
jgi:hypothetical protein